MVEQHTKDIINTTNISHLVLFIPHTYINIIVYLNKYIG